MLQIELIFCSISFNLVAPSPASCSVTKPSQFILVSIPRVTLPSYTVYLPYFTMYLPYFTMYLPYFTMYLPYFTIMYYLIISIII